MEYSRFVDVFGGSSSVLLGKPAPDDFEVYNDFDHNLVNLFHCMKKRTMATIRELGFFNQNSRDDFNKDGDIEKKWQQGCKPSPILFFNVVINDEMGEKRTGKLNVYIINFPVYSFRKHNNYPITALIRLTPEDELSSFNILNDLSSPV